MPVFGEATGAGNRTSEGGRVVGAAHGERATAEAHAATRATAARHGENGFRTVVYIEAGPDRVGEGHRNCIRKSTTIANLQRATGGGHVAGQTVGASNVALVSAVET